MADISKEGGTASCRVAPRLCRLKPLATEKNSTAGVLRFGDNSEAQKFAARKRMQCSAGELLPNRKPYTKNNVPRINKNRHVLTHGSLGLLAEARHPVGNSALADASALAEVEPPTSNSAVKDASALAEIRPPAGNSAVADACALAEVRLPGGNSALADASALAEVGPPAGNSAVTRAFVQAKAKASANNPANTGAVALAQTSCSKRGQQPLPTNFVSLGIKRPLATSFLFSNLAASNHFLSA